MVHFFCGHSHINLRKLAAKDIRNVTYCIYANKGEANKLITNWCLRTIGVTIIPGNKFLSVNWMLCRNRNILVYLFCNNVVDHDVIKQVGIHVQKVGAQARANFSLWARSAAAALALDKTWCHNSGLHGMRSLILETRRAWNLS